MLPWVLLATLAVVAVALLIVGIRVQLRIFRLTVARYPELRRLPPVSHLSSWNAAKVLRAHMTAMDSYGRADPQIRRLTRARTACYVGAALFGLLPVLYLALFFQHFM